MKLLYFIVFLFITQALFSQEEKKSMLNSIDFEGYIEPFYLYNFSENESMPRNYSFNHVSSNRLMINIARAKFSIDKENYRATIGIMGGEYVRYNLAAEPAALRHFYPATAGIKIADSLWLDAGILESYMGFESIIGIDNYTLTRSLTAEHSPYYLSGAMLSYKPNSKLDLKLIYSNGWQIIYQAGKSTPSIGWQISYTPTEKVSFNSSSYYSNTFYTRIFHDFYCKYKPTERLDFVMGFDNGMDIFLNSNATWWNATAIAYVKMSEKTALGIRAEAKHDPLKRVVDYISNEDFMAYGGSINFDYKVAKDAFFRIEYRSLQSNNYVFTEHDSMGNLLYLKKDQHFITSCIGVRF